MSIIWVILMPGMLFFSCKKDSPRPAPTIEFLSGANYISNDTNIYAGDDLLAGIECQWNGTDLIRSFNLYANEVLVGSEIIPENFGQGFKIDSISLVKSQAPSETWVFEVVDAQGQKGFVSFILTLNNTGQVPLNSNATIGAQQNTINQSYYSLSTNMNYDAEEASTNYNKIDLLCAYDEVNLIHLISPGADNLPEPFATQMAGWPSKNNTIFCKTSLSTAQFDLINRDNLLINSFSNNVNNQVLKIQQLTVGDIISFKTQDGRFGLIKVSNVVPGIGGKIVIQVKIQPLSGK